MGGKKEWPIDQASTSEAFAPNWPLDHLVLEKKEWPIDQTSTSEAFAPNWPLDQLVLVVGNCLRCAL